MESSLERIWETAWPWPALEFELEPASTALILVDLQRQTVEPELGELAALERLRPRSGDYRQQRLTENVLPNSRRLLAYFRSRGLRVVHLTSGPETADHRDLSWVVRRRNTQRAALAGLPLAYAKGEPGHAIIDELAPLPEELVVNKVTVNPFFGSHLDPLLRNLGVESLVVAGVGTNGSVDGLARGASDLGYQVVVVEDAVTGDDPYLERQSVRSYLTIFGRGQSTEGVLAELDGDVVEAAGERTRVEAALLTPRAIPAEELSMAEPWPAMEFGLPEGRTGLLIVDMQYFCHPDFGMASAMEVVSTGYTSYSRGSFTDIVPKCRILLEAFRERGWPVAHLTIGPELPDQSTPPVPMFRRNKQRERYCGRPLTFSVGSFEHGIVEELAPLPTEPVVNKLTASGFMTSKIDQVLRNMDVQGLVIAGIATNACVESTARDAADRGYRCLLVEDACAAFDPAFHEMTVRSFRNIFGRVGTMAGTLEELFGAAKPADVAAVG